MRAFSFYLPGLPGSKIINLFLFFCFIYIASGQHVDNNLCVTVPNGVNVNCEMGNFIPIPYLELYHSHGSFYNFCLNKRVETQFHYDTSFDYCYNVISLEPCSNLTRSGDSHYCTVNTCDINSPCYCLSGFMQDSVSCVIEGVAEPLVLISNDTGGIILNRDAEINMFYLNDFGLPNFIKASDGFIISYEYPFQILLSTPYGRSFIKSGLSTSIYYKFDSELLKTNFRYNGVILDSNNQSLSTFSQNHTSISACQKYEMNPCYLCKSSFTEFNCKDIEDKLVTISLFSIFFLVIIALFVLSILVLVYCIKLLFKPINRALLKFKQTRFSIQTRLILRRWKYRVTSCFSSGINPSRIIVLVMLSSGCFASNGSDYKACYPLVLYLISLICIRLKKPVNFTYLAILVISFSVFTLACESGATFNGQVSTCDVNGVCRISASTSGISDFIGEEVCLNFLDDNNNGVLQLKLEIVSIFYRLAYSLVYFTGDRQVVGYGQSHCYGIGHCPSNCNSTSYTDRTNGGMFTNPIISLTKGELTCYRYDISGFCPFPGDDCQYCGSYILPQGEPYKVFRYDSYSLPNFVAKLTFISPSYSEEGIFTFVKGISKTVCFSTVCFNIDLNTNSEYLFNPNIEYVTFPGFITGSSDIFSLPSLPVFNKIGDIQSTSPSPWSSSDYSNIIYSPSVVNTQPSLSGCTTSVVSSRLNSNNPSLPFYKSGVYYVPSSYDTFDGIEAHKANTSSTFYTISTTTNSTILRVVNSNMFTIQGDPTFTGCCDCITGAEICFTAAMSTPSGTGEINSENIIFTNPIFRDGPNCLSFRTNDCDMNNHEFEFTTNSMSLTYSFDVTLNEVDIPSFSELKYTTLNDFNNDMSNSEDQDMNVGDFLENIFGFKNNNVSTILGSLIYGLIALCLILLIIFCMVQCCLRFIKPKSN